MNSINFSASEFALYKGYPPTTNRNNLLNTAFNGYILTDIINFKGLSLKQITESLKKYNFQPDIANNKLMAEMTLTCLQDVENKGFKIPVHHNIRLVINNENPAVTSDMIKEKFGCFHSDNYKYIPLLSRILPPRFAGLLYFNPDCSDLPPDKLKRDIYHEIGHFLHLMNSPKIFKCLTVKNLHGSAGELYNQYMALEAIQQHKGLIRKHVSEYAASKPQEFVAEVFAELMLGNKFDEEGVILNLYKKMGGPIACKA